MSSVRAQRLAGTDLLQGVSPGALMLQSAEALPGLSMTEHVLEHLTIQDLNSQETRSYQRELSCLEKVCASFFASYRSLEGYIVKLFQETKMVISCWSAVFSSWGGTNYSILIFISVFI